MLAIGSVFEPGHVSQPAVAQWFYVAQQWLNLPADQPRLDLDAIQDNLPLNNVQGLTDTTIQVALLRSLPLRLQIARVVNNFRSGPSYKETLRLSTELSDLYQEAAVIMDPRINLSHQPTTFQRKLYNLMTQRFILVLHDPFSMQAKANLSYAPSRKFTLNNALHILSSAPTPPTEPTDYTSLCLSGTSSFRDVPMQAAAVLCDELLTQIAKDKTIKPPPTPTKQYNDLLRPLDAFLTSNLVRLQIGETNV